MKKIKLILALAFTFFSGLKGLNVIVLPYSFLQTDTQDVKIHLLLGQEAVTDSKGTVYYPWKDFGYIVSNEEIEAIQQQVYYQMQYLITPEELMHSSAVNLLKEKTMGIFNEFLDIKVIPLYEFDTVVFFIKVPYVFIENDKFLKARKDLLKKNQNYINDVCMQKINFKWISVERLNEMMGMDTKLFGIFKLQKIKNFINQISIEINTPLQQQSLQYLSIIAPKPLHPLGELGQKIKGQEIAINGENLLIYDYIIPLVDFRPIEVKSQ